jgi:hypothetical protein
LGLRSDWRLHLHHRADSRRRNRVQLPHDWNNYLENPETHFHTGDLLDFEFALSEHIGKFQLGFAGFYAYQPDDDQINGVRIPPDGNPPRLFRSDLCWPMTCRSTT